MHLTYHYEYSGIIAQVSHRDLNWQDRLHIIPCDPYCYLGLPIAMLTARAFGLINSETEASAIHSVALTKFQPDQVFMICDAGGSTIVCHPPPHFQEHLIILLGHGYIPHPTCLGNPRNRGGQLALWLVLWIFVSGSPLS